VKEGKVMKDCKCHARAIETERQEMWKRIFPPDGNVPITCPIPVGRGNLAGQEADFYLLDFDRVSHTEKEALIFEMAEKFNLAPIEIRREIEAQGAPVKADRVFVSWCKNHSLAAL